MDALLFINFTLIQKRKYEDSYLYSKLDKKVSGCKVQITKISNFFIV